MRDVSGQDDEARRGSLSTGQHAPGTGSTLDGGGAAEEQIVQSSGASGAATRIPEEELPPAAQTFPLPLHASWLTKVILVTNVLVFLLLSLASQRPFMTALLGGAEVRTLVQFGAKFNEGILQGEYWRLLTPVFLHIGLVHLLFNMYALASFGREVEQLFGTWRFAIVYFLSGIGGSVASFALNPAVSAGASGAIFGIIGALTVFLARNRHMLGDMGKQQLRSLLVVIGINLFIFGNLPGIDNYGHLGGLLTGAALSLFFAPTYQLRSIQIYPFFVVTERPARLPATIIGLLGLAFLIFATFLSVPFAVTR